MNLHNLEKPLGSKKKPKRVGRGPGSGSGKTCGKGQKGQKSRSGGKVRRGFEGGQMPLYRRLPKFGFTNPNAVTFSIINLSTLENRSDVASGEVLTKNLLKEKRIVRNLNHPIKLLADGTLTKSLKIEVDKASQTALEKVKAAGGEVLLKV